MLHCKVTTFHSSRVSHLTKSYTLLLLLFLSLLKSSLLLIKCN